MDISPNDAGGLESLVVDVLVYGTDHERHLVKLELTGGVAHVRGLFDR